MMLALAATVRLMAVIGAIAVLGAIIFAPELFLELGLMPAEANALKNWAGICFGVLMLAYALPSFIAAADENKEEGFLARASAQNERLGARPVMRLLFALSQVSLLFFVVFGWASRN